MRHSITFAALMFVASVMSATPASAISIGLIDTFQDGTTDAWFAGGLGFGVTPPVPPQNVATGGATGANDRYLQITSQGGNGPGSRLVGMNLSQWAGNYLTGGFSTIEMDLRNFGATDLSIRLLFENPMFGPPADIAVTTAAAVLPAGGGWSHFAFSILTADLTALLGTASNALGSTTLLRIIHSPTASEASPIAGVLGVDNISAGPVPRPGPFSDAVPVPEPGSMLLMASGLALLARRRRRDASRS